MFWIFSPGYLHCLTLIFVFNNNNFNAFCNTCSALAAAVAAAFRRLLRFAETETNFGVAGVNNEFPMINFDGVSCCELSADQQTDRRQPQAQETMRSPAERGERARQSRSQRGREANIKRNF